MNHHWFLRDFKNPNPESPKVFSCFHGGGGSSMGYLRAGFKVLGGVEIDPAMMDVYRANLNPQHSFLMGVQTFKAMPDSKLPKELFGIDVLDGSPPCSSFSMAGSRSKHWGREVHFREGQAKQVLDELFFDFIDVAEKLKPKVIVAENVKGLISEKARGYVKQIRKRFDNVGYDLQLFLLNAAFMGVPQRRERVFFVARKKALNLDPLVLDFNDPIIAVADCFKTLKPQHGRPLTDNTTRLWMKLKPGETLAKAHPRASRFNEYRLPKDSPAQTLTANSKQYHHSEPRHLTAGEVSRLATFPDDYNFLKMSANYVAGMSVPPKMMEKVAIEIRKQWLSKFILRKK